MNKSKYTVVKTNTGLETSMKNTVDHQSILMIQIKLDNFWENMSIRQIYF